MKIKAAMLYLNLPYTNIEVIMQETHIYTFSIASKHIYTVQLLFIGFDCENP